MADNKIIFDAGLRLGLDQKQLDNLQKLIEKSLKADIDVSGVRKASQQTGLKIEARTQKLLNDLLAGQRKVEDLSPKQREQVERAYGQLARQLENSRTYYREIDKLARATNTNIEAAMASLKNGIERLANQIKSIRPQMDVPRTSQRAVADEERRLRSEQQMRARMQARAQKQQDDQARRAAQFEANLANIMAREPGRQQQQTKQRLASTASFSAFNQRAQEVERRAQEKATKQRLASSAKLAGFQERGARQEAAAQEKATKQRLASNLALARFTERPQAAQERFTQATEQNRIRRERGAQVVEERGLGDSFRGTGQADLKAAREYLSGQLSALNSLKRSLSASLGRNSAETKKAAEESVQYAKALGAVNKEVNRLAATEKKARKDRQEYLKQQKQLAKQGEQSQLARSLREQGQYQTVVGPRGAGVNMALASDDYQAREKDRGRRRQELEERREKAQLALDKEFNKVVSQTVKSRDQANKAQEDRTRRIALAEAQYAEALQTAAKRFPRGAAVAASGDFDKIDTRPEASQTRQFLNASLTAAQTMQKRYTADFGKDSAQAKQAAADVDRYARSLGVVAEKYDLLASKGTGLANTFQAFTRYALGYGALYQVLGGVQALISNITQLDQDLKSIQAVSLSTDKQMESLAGSIERVALQTKFTNAEIADAVRTLVQAGTAAGEIDSVVQATANFASATNSSLQTSADLITSVRSVFDDLSDNTIANQLTNAVNISKLQAEDLQTIVSLGAQVANAYKISSDQFLAAVSTLRNAGIKPSTVATGLRQMMLEVFSPDAKTIEVMRSRYAALGEEMSAESIRSRFSGFTEAENPLVSAIGELRRLGFAGEARQDFARNFDVRAYNPLLALVQQYDKLLENEAKVTFGAPAAEAAAIQMEALTAKFENLGGAITALSASLAGPMVKSIGEVVTSATRGIEEIRNLRNESITGVPTSGGAAEPGFVSQAASTVIEGVRKGQDVGSFVMGGGLAGYAYREATRTPEEEKNQRADEVAEVSRALNDQLAQASARIQEFEEAASNFNIEAAKVGDATGKSSEALVESSHALNNMEDGLSELFGKVLPDVNSRLIGIAESYVKMGAEQRKAKFKSLAEGDASKGEAPIPELENFSFAQFDTRMTAIATESVRLNSYLKSLSESTLQTLMRYNDIVLDARDKSENELSALEVQARRFVQEFLDNEAFRNVVLGDSTEGAQRRLEIFQQAQQNIADGIMDFAVQSAGNEVENLRKAALGKDIERALENSSSEVAKVQIRAAITSLFNSIKGLSDESVKQIRGVEKTIQETAIRLRREGNLQGAADVETFLPAADQEIRKREGVAREERVARVRNVQENIVPALKEPQFQKYIEQEAVQLTPQQRQAAVQYLQMPEDPSLVSAARQNSDLYKQMESMVAAYRQGERNRILSEEKLAEALNRRATLEEQLADVEQQLNQAKGDKNFQAVPDLVNQRAVLRQQINDKSLEKETDAFKGLTAAEKETGKGATQLERVGKLEKERNRIETERLREIEQNARQESEARRSSQQRTLELLKAQAEVQLDAAILDDNDQAIQEFGTQINDINSKLLELFKQDLETQGIKQSTNKELFDAEVAAKQEELRMIQDQVAYRQKVYEAEQADMDRRLAELESNAPGQTDSRYDAVMRRGGVEPQAGRQEYLEKREKIFTDREGQLQTNREQIVSELSEPGLTAEKQRQLNDELFRTERELEAVRAELADINLESEKFMNFQWGDMFSGSSWKEGFSGASQMIEDTVNLTSEKLLNSQDSFDNWANNTSDSVAGAFENMGDIFADSLMDMEGAGMSFSDLLKDNFNKLGQDLLRTAIKTISNQAFGSLMSMLTGGAGGGAGIGGMAMSALGGLFAKDGGIVKMASGGIIKGPGTGTSDSIMGVIHGKGGKKAPVAVSTGESILTAKATRNLGENFVHAANSGKLFRMAEGGMVPPVAGNTPATDKLEKASDKQAGAVAAAVQQAPINLTIQNNFDSGDVTSAGLKSAAGQRELTNAVRANKETFNSILNN